MQTAFSKNYTYNPPKVEDAIYLKQYDEGYQAAMLGKPDENPYQTLDAKYSKVQDLRSYYWQAGYRDYEGA